MTPAPVDASPAIVFDTPTTTKGSEVDAKLFQRLARELIVPAQVRGIPYTEAQINLFARVLADVPDDIGQAAVEAIVMADTEGWPIVPGALRRECFRIAGLLPPDVDEALASLDKATPDWVGQLGLHLAIEEALRGAINPGNVAIWQRTATDAHRTTFRMLYEGTKDTQGVRERWIVNSLAPGGFQTAVMERDQRHHDREHYRAGLEAEARAKADEDAETADLTAEQRAENLRRLHDLAAQIGQSIEDEP